MGIILSKINTTVWFFQVVLIVISSFDHFVSIIVFREASDY